MLEIKNLSAGYKPGIPVLEDFSLTLQAGERVGITGQNGTGKSTLAKAIMGLTPWATGTLTFEGTNLLPLAPHHRNKLGIVYFMQGGRVYRQLTVEENLKIAGSGIKNFNLARELHKLEMNELPLFAKAGRMKLAAGNLSGGERHLLAFAMTILSCPGMKLLVADEPSAGMAQTVQKDVFFVLFSFLSKVNCSLVLIEQNSAFLNNLTSNKKLYINN